MNEGLHEVLREFTGAILNPYDLDELLHRLTGHTMDLLDASGCGIMLQNDEGRLAFAAASDDGVVRVELHQEQVSEGACHDAYQRNELIIIEDIRTGGNEWPGYRDRVVDAGFHAVLGVPMNAVGRTIGVMNVYRQTPGPWSDADVEAAQILTAVGAGYIVHANDLRAHHDLTDNLQAAITSRDLIGQAKGIIMEREGVDAEEAFGLLRTLSQRENRKLREIAQLVVDGQVQIPRDR
jgi:signal transduction protein with GAF and PtsI domain